MNTWCRCSHSSIWRDFSWSTSCIRLLCFPTSGSLYWFRSGLLADHRAGVMKSLVFHELTAARYIHGLHGHALWAGALSCWKVKMSPDRSRRADRRCWWTKTPQQYWPFTFVPWSMKSKPVYAPDCSQQPKLSPIARTSNVFSQHNVTSWTNDCSQ